jgi:hypothetical protein
MIEANKTPRTRAAGPARPLSLEPSLRDIPDALSRSLPAPFSPQNGPEHVTASELKFRRFFIQNHHHY